MTSMPVAFDDAQPVVATREMDAIDVIRSLVLSLAPGVGLTLLEQLHEERLAHLQADHRLSSGIAQEIRMHGYDRVLRAFYEDRGLVRPAALRSFPRT